VRKDGNEVRITAQLIQVNDGTHLWTESYNRELLGVFAMEEEIASAIAGALHVPLGLNQGESLVSNHTTNEEAYDAYLRARAFVRVRAIAEAIEILEPAVMRDANYAPAWSLLALAYGLGSGYAVEDGISVEERRRLAEFYGSQAEMAVQRAIQLDPNSAATYMTLAIFQPDARDWKAREDLFRQALAIDPDEPDALHFSSMWLSAAGRLNEALAIRERIRTLEPFVPVYNVDTAEIMLLTGQYEASVPLFKAVPLEGAVGARRNIDLARAYADLGRYDEAADTILAIPLDQNLVGRQSVEDVARLLRNASAGISEAGDLPDLEGDLNFAYAYIGEPERVLEFPECQFQRGGAPYMHLCRFGTRCSQVYVKPNASKP
jgi:tetratricopeptide (TPR) repeat protein